jgi:molybdopterin synthase sulfur carrier subunit
MRVTVRLFARLRDIAGTGELTRDAPEHATLTDVWRGLVNDFPAFEPYTPAISGARNADYVTMDTALAEGDEVAFLPPVSGG